MTRAGLLLAAVAAPAALAAGMWAGENRQAPANIVTAGRQNAPLVTKPGWGVAGAARYFAELNAPPPPPPPVRAIPPPPPPPEPDVGLLLRRDVSAVLGAEGSEPRLVLGGGRHLARGEAYRDGWTLSSLTSQTATLTRAKEQKTVNLFGPIPAAETTQLASAAALGPISFSNSQRPGQMSSSQINQLMTILRQSGTGEGQLNNLRQTLQSGQSLPFNQLMQLLMTAGRGGPGGRGQVSPAQISAFVGSLSNSGLMTQQQANQINQNVSQMGNQQVNNIVRQITQPPQPPQPNRGGGPATPNAGFATPAPPQPARPAGTRQ